jgi:hypothetical protein
MGKDVVVAEFEALPHNYLQGVKKTMRMSCGMGLRSTNSNNWSATFSSVAMKGKRAVRYSVFACIIDSL